MRLRSFAALATILLLPAFLPTAAAQTCTGGLFGVCADGELGLRGASCSPPDFFGFRLCVADLEWSYSGSGSTGSLGGNVAATLECTNTGCAPIGTTAHSCAWTALNPRCGDGPFLAQARTDTRNCNAFSWTFELTVTARDFLGAQATDSPKPTVTARFPEC